MQLRPTSMLLFAIVPVRRIRAKILKNRYWSFNLILIVWVIRNVTLRRIRILKGY